MQREVRLLKERSVESLVLAIELFNRPRDEGRVAAVLIHLDHAFEMLLKAAIRQRGGRIRKPRETGTIGFKDCVNRCRTDAQVQCLSRDQGVALMALNGWRDAAQHYILDLPEEQLYIAAQGAVTMFDDLLSQVFRDRLARHIPERVLPISTKPPADLDLLLDEEFGFLARQLRPGQRRVSEVKARLRPIAILEAATRGDDRQPSEADLRRRVKEIQGGADWRSMFPGVAALRLDTEGTGLTFSLRLTKREGMPVKLTTEGDAAAATVAVKRVNELDFYCFGFDGLASKLPDVGRNRLVAVIRHLGLQEDERFYKRIVLGKVSFGRYSQEALKALREELPRLDVEAIWRAELAARREKRLAGRR